MNRLIIALMLALNASSLCLADDLTDAITSVDPRSRLQTGMGAALNDVLGPEENAEESTDLSENLESATTLPTYGLTTKELLDPMGTADEEGKELSADEAAGGDDALGGYANQEAGVHYQDAYSPSSTP